jgi:uncharacterized membrane protein
MWFFIFAGFIILVSFFIQRKIYAHATRKIFKIMPLISLAGLLACCGTVYLFKIYMIKSKEFYIQMAVDEAEVMFMFYAVCILTAIVGCVLGIAANKIMGRIRNKACK